MERYKIKIGIEVHVQVNSKTKMFCSCSVDFGGEPNSRICPICTGQPGVLPAINKDVVNKAIIAANALNCEINRESSFDRKNYFYPDLPKNYQITQQRIPIGEEGYVLIRTSKGEKKIRVRRIHMEEDTGKLIHDISDETLVDFNRSGVPLLEIVTYPDVENEEEAVAYITRLRQILIYAGVSEASMEKGHFRAEPNISVTDMETGEGNVRSEIKNLNSLKAVERGIKKEIERQTQMLKNGEKITQLTMLWDEKKQDLRIMRSKETKLEYRYFPEPDLGNLVLSAEYVDRIKNTTPKLPYYYLDKFTDKGLSRDKAEILILYKETAEMFDTILEYNVKSDAAFNLYQEILSMIKEYGKDVIQNGIEAKEFANILKMLDKGEINRTQAKDLIKKRYTEKTDINKLIEKYGYKQVSSEDEIENLVKEVLNENPKEVERYKNGDLKLQGFFMGQIMKKSRGKANPAIAGKILKKLIG